ncbi:class I SAM-dependent methyltransferase [Geodermatophilus sp. SYSU D00758]
MTTSLDPERVERFASTLFDHYTGGLLTYLVDLGDRTGLFEAAAQAPGSSAEIADRAGVHERYAREWLGAMTTAGVVAFEPATRTYTLPPEHAACLTGAGSGNLARFSGMITHLGSHLAAVAAAFRTGGGVPYEDFRPDFTDVMDAANRNAFDEHLVADVLPLAPGLVERLRAGARVMELGCGTGHATVLLAQAFPASTFVGYDLAEDALDRGRQEAADRGLGNVTFERRDVTALAPPDPVDLVLTVDTIHDLPDPEAVLVAAGRSLRPGGVLLMIDPRVSSDLEDNVGNPFAPMVYAVSALHCLPVARAAGGEGLGTAYGEQRAIALLTAAGFTGISVHAAPGDPIDAVFVARRPAA